jgi:iron complex transport system substrate-binding protein
LIVLIGCDNKQPVAPPTTAPAVRIASLSPAATDLLLSMNAGRRLIAVSEYDKDRNDTRGLPVAGDYQKANWEMLATLKPTAMVVQGRPDRMPAGLKANADSLGIKVVNIQIDNLDDIFRVAGVLGDAMADPVAATAKVTAIKGQLDAIRQRVRGKVKVRTLIVVDTSGQYVAGHTTFLTDLLEIAGGENVVPKESGPWPSVDREMLLSLKPDAILQLLPGASPQVLEKAKATWSPLGDVPAVKNGQVYQVTEWYVNQPGARVGDTAKLFADKLHP